MPLTLSFTLTADEYLEGQKLFTRSLAPRIERFRYRYSVPIGVLLLADGIMGFALRWNPGICVFIISVGALLILRRTFFWPRQVKKELSQYPDLAGGLNMEFRDEKILVQTSQMKSETDWSRLTRFVETDKLFVLFAPPRFLYMIPKRVLSVDESDQFRQLLHRKLQGAKLSR